MGASPCRRSGDENRFQTPIAVGIQSTRCHRFVAPYNSLCTYFVLGTGVGHNGETAIAPKVSLRSESMRSGFRCDDLRCPDRSHLRNRSQQLDRSVALAFGQDSRLGLLPEFTKMIQLLIGASRPLVP